MGISNAREYKSDSNSAILVTGASGFLAQVLIDEILKSNPNKKLILVANSQVESLKARFSISSHSARVSVLKHDFEKSPLADLTKKLENPEKIETIFHLACPNPGTATLGALMAVNVNALNELAAFFYPYFNRRGSGQFYVMGSRYASHPSQEAELLNYAVAKGAQLSATRYWALAALFPTIKFVYLAPDAIASPLNRMREIESPVPAEEFCKHLTQNMDHYTNGDWIQFQFNGEILETHISLNGEVLPVISGTAAATPNAKNVQTHQPSSVLEEAFLKRVRALFHSTKQMSDGSIWALRFQGLPEWDSLGHLRLIVDLETYFKKKIPAKSIAKLSTMRAVFEALQ